MVKPSNGLCGTSGNVESISLATRSDVTDDFEVCERSIH